jgi:hypothetical protein
MKGSWARFVSLAAAVLMPGIAFAQPGAASGLTGTIRDSSGAVLIAATITVSSPQSIGGERAAAPGLCT